MLGTRHCVPAIPAMERPALCKERKQPEPEALPLQFSRTSQFTPLG